LGKADIETDIFAARVGCPAIGGFHNAGSAAGANHVAIGSVAESFGPLGDHFGQRAGVFVIIPERPVFADSRGAEEDDGVANALSAEV